ncbi:hypothetical protein Q7C36_010252 [Tachysurus vachellii]|uniref:Uncharacterized protein n=1 Tax=Tachysurus vachellii TaxID=175792 RepID=A0AA88MYH9_TACVA|nr:hypothetical protein Q7C36_010252 [Tachysurus vachellii]
MCRLIWVEMTDVMRLPGLTERRRLALWRAHDLRGDTYDGARAADHGKATSVGDRATRDATDETRRDETNDDDERTVTWK